MKSSEDVRKQFEEHQRISRHGLRNQYRHVQECQAFYSGDYMNYRDEYQFGLGSSRRIKEVQFNRVKPYVNSIVGFAVQQRRKPDYQARMEDRQEQIVYTEYLNGYSDYIRENNNSDQIETKQDLDLIIGGIGFTDTAITLKAGTPTRDPSGEIITERVEPSEVGWDPTAVEPNITDSRWIYRVKEYDVQEAVDLFDADEEEFEYISNEDNIYNYEYNPFGGIQDKIGFEWADSQRRMARVYFYQWFDVESFYRVENPLLRNNNMELSLALVSALSQVERDEQDELFMFDPTAETLVLTKENRNQVRGIFESFEIPFNPVKEKRKVYYTAIISGKKVFSRFKSPSQQGFTIKAKTGDRDEVNNIWTGIVASLRDPQRYYNKSLTELMIIIANNSRGGVIYEEDAVDNVQEFENSWSRTDGAVRVNPGALSGGKIKPKADPHMPNGYEQIIQVTDQSMGQVTGIDESFFGVVSGGNETAMLQRQRIKQATTTLACYFDSIGLYAKEQARMMLSYMRMLADSSQGQLFRTSDENDDIVFERVSSEFFADEYDVVIGEAPETPIQKEYYTQTLISMAQSMQAIGDQRYVQLYAAAVKYMPIPNRDKQSIIQIMVGEQPVDPAMVQQMQMRLQQLESQGAQLQADKLMADIQKVRADTRKSLVDGEKTLADKEKTIAETEETYEDVEKKSIENDLMELKDPDDVDVVV